MEKTKSSKIYYESINNHKQNRTLILIANIFGVIGINFMLFQQNKCISHVLRKFVCKALEVDIFSRLEHQRAFKLVMIFCQTLFNYSISVRTKQRMIVSAVDAAILTNYNQ